MASTGSCFLDLFGHTQSFDPSITLPGLPITRAGTGSVLLPRVARDPSRDPEKHRGRKSCLAPSAPLGRGPSGRGRHEVSEAKEGQPRRYVGVAECVNKKPIS